MEPPYSTPHEPKCASWSVFTKNHMKAPIIFTQPLRPPTPHGPTDLWIYEGAWVSIIGPIISLTYLSYENITVITS